MVNGNLPEGWQTMQLEKCVEILDNRRKPINSEEREKRISGKDESQLYPYYGATGRVGLIDDYLLDEEVVLLGEDGAPFLDFGKDKAYIVRGKSWVNNHAHVLKAREEMITNLFLMHYLNYFDYHGYVTGTTRLKLNQGQMRQFPIKIAPLSEQERIVAKIEELFTQLDAGMSALERVQAGLRRYKASVLKAACEGKLVSQEASDQPANILYKRILDERRKRWKSALLKRGDKARNTKYSEPELPEIENEDLPSGWEWASLDSLTYRVTYGITVRPKYVEEGVPIISAREIRSGEINLEISHKISNHDYEKLRHNCILYYDDVLFSKTGTIGHVARVKHDMPLSVSQNVAVLSPVVWSKYLEIVLRSPTIQRLAQSKVKTTAIPDLQLGLMKRFPIPLPPLEEQRRIVAEVERRLSVAREVESVVEKALVRAGRLRQAVLKSAFEGRL